MENEKPNYYAIIPADVRYDNNIPPASKLLYGEITCLSNKEGYCFATNNYFANLYNVTPQAVSRWIKALVDNGYIKSELIYNGKEVAERRLYLRGVSINCLGGINKKLIGYQLNVKDNNTRVNNTSINIPQKKKGFVPPTKEDVEAYCRENNLKIDIDRFFNYYAPDWKDRDNKPVKNWKQRVRTWANNNFSSSKQKGTLWQEENKIIPGAIDVMSQINF